MCPSTASPPPHQPSPFHPIDRSSRYPIYLQIYNQLRDAIWRGFWQPGDKLPTEQALIAQFEVSRISIRQAFDRLVSENLVYRHQGRGTFVAKPSIRSDAMRIINFSDDMARRGLKPSTRLLSKQLVPVSLGTAERLQIPMGDTVAVIQRLRLADDEVISLEVSTLVHAYCPGILNKHDYAQYSLRRTLLEDYNIRLVRATQTIQAILATKELARQMHIAPGSAILLLNRLTYSQREIPVEVLLIYYRADRYILHHDLLE